MNIYTHFYFRNPLACFSRKQAILLTFPASAPISALPSIFALDAPLLFVHAVPCNPYPHCVSAILTRVRRAACFFAVIKKRAAFQQLPVPYMTFNSNVAPWLPLTCLLVSSSVNFFCYNAFSHPHPRLSLAIHLSPIYDTYCDP